jgi:hypothetical protein
MTAAPPSLRLHLELQRQPQHPLQKHHPLPPLQLHLQRPLAAQRPRLLLQLHPPPRALVPVVVVAPAHFLRAISGLISAVRWRTLPMAGCRLRTLPLP